MFNMMSKNIARIYKVSEFNIYKIMGLHLLSECGCHIMSMYAFPRKLVMLTILKDLETIVLISNYVLIW